LKIVAALLAVLTLLSGCGDVQSALNAAGPSASMLKHLILFIVAVSLVVWLAVIAILILSLVRSRRVAQDETASGKRLQLFVTGAVMMTVFIVAGLTLASFLATRAISFTGYVFAPSNGGGSSYTKMPHRMAVFRPPTKCTSRLGGMSGSCSKARM
jgi:cytochrome c oxidase subunit II